MSRKNLSYAERQRSRNPLLWEKTKLVIDAVTSLRVALEDLRMPQSELARLMGRSRSIISRQLRGTENLTLGKLAELALAVGKRFELSLTDIELSVGIDDSNSDRPSRIAWERERAQPNLKLASIEKISPPSGGAIAA